MTRSLRVRDFVAVALAVVAPGLALFVVLGILPRPQVHHVNLLITLSAAALLALSKALDRRLVTGAGVALAIVALVNYWSYFNFHGNRTYTHVHELAHYYLGSKYFAELGYTDLYEAVLLACENARTEEIEQARDLATNELKAVDEVLAGAAETRDRFTAERWRDFVSDARFFCRGLGEAGYRRFLRDHGFNATPLWAWVGGELGELMSPVSVRKVRFLSLLDAVLLVGTFAAVGWAFGGRTSLVCLTLFCTLYGAEFDWIGGAYLRFMWFFGVVVGICLLQRRFYAGAGSLIAVAACLRIFPAVFVIGILSKLVTKRRRERGHLRFIASFVLTTALLIGFSVFWYRGFHEWWTFVGNMSVYLRTSATNLVGLKATFLPIYELFGSGLVAIIGGVVLFVVRALALAWVVVLSRRFDDVGATVLGVLVLFVMLTMGGYYYVFMVLLVIAHRDDTRALAWIFAVEGLTYFFHLFVDPATTLFVVRGLLLLLLFGVLYLDAGEREVRAWIDRASVAD